MAPWCKIPAKYSAHGGNDGMASRCKVPAKCSAFGGDDYKSCYSSGSIRSGPSLRELLTAVLTA